MCTDRSSPGRLWSSTKGSFLTEGIGIVVRINNLKFFGSYHKLCTRFREVIVGVAYVQGEGIMSIARSVIGYEMVPD